MKEDTTPQCVGFIMDGNRRFAQSVGQPALFGHEQGYRVFKEMIEVVRSEGIPHVVYYAFSTENWQRSREEVSGIFGLVHHAGMEYLAADMARQKKTIFRFVGDRSRLSEGTRGVIERLETVVGDTESVVTVWVLLSYGGRAEIVAAVNKAVAAGLTVDEEDFSKLLWTADMPDPDLIIRTGGERRLSNFLPWQSVYSELFFTDTYWPAFTAAEFHVMLAEYRTRHRRRGR